MIDRVAFAQRAMRAWSVDWIFVAFVISASVVFCHEGWSRWRARTALDDVARCVAVRDEACAVEALARAREHAPGHERILIGEAGLRLLTHELAFANSLLVPLEGRSDLDERTSGELSLVQGDRLLAEGRTEDARESYERARSMVPEEVLEPRMAHLHELLRGAASERRRLRSAIRTQFDRLFRASEASDRAAFDAARSELTRALGRVPPKAQTKFGSAIWKARSTRSARPASAAAKERSKRRAGIALRDARRLADQGFEALDADTSWPLPQAKPKRAPLLDGP